MQTSNPARSMDVFHDESMNIPTRTGKSVMTDTMRLGDMKLRIEIKRSKGASAGINVLEELTFEELCTLIEVTVDEYSPAGTFMVSLKEAYLLMINRIVERNPGAKSFKNPKSYPEFEIYDSVFGVLEDNEIESLAFEFGFTDNSGANLQKVSTALYDEINELFCRESGWDFIHARKIKSSKIVPLELHRDLPKMPSTLGEVEAFTKQLFELENK